MILSRTAITLQNFDRSILQLIQFLIPLTMFSPFLFIYSQTGTLTHSFKVCVCQRNLKLDVSWCAQKSFPVTLFIMVCKVFLTFARVCSWNPNLWPLNEVIERQFPVVLFSVLFKVLLAVSSRWTKSLSVSCVTTQMKAIEQYRSSFVVVHYSVQFCSNYWNWLSELKPRCHPGHSRRHFTQWQETISDWLRGFSYKFKVQLSPQYLWHWEQSSIFHFRSFWAFWLTE